MHRASSTKQRLEPAALPFGGLGLDLAEVRRTVSGLLLVPFPKWEAREQEPHPEAPPAAFGVELLVLLGRQTLGS